MLGEIKDGELYIEGLHYPFPPRPPLKKIRNAGLPRAQQKWTRREEYMQFDWSEGWQARLNYEENVEQLEYLVDEVERLNDGEWIYIDGEPTYINNFCYFFLQWYILEDSGEYPEYRDTSLYYYRFIEIVNNTRLCTGHTLLKARRLGATSMVIALMVLKALLTRNKKFGITSKTGDDARDAFAFLTNAFQALPVFLKPFTEGNDAPKKILSLKKQAERIKKEQQTGSERVGLNNKIEWRATGLNTFDSGAWEIVLVDESGKYPTEVPIDAYLPIVTKCAKQGAQVTGKLMLPTTVNSPQSGGAKYRLVWNTSDQMKADYLGQTTTGLYRIMIPAYYGFNGYIDQFGNSVWDTPTAEQSKYLASTGKCPDPTIGAKAYQLHCRKQLELEGDEEKLQEEIRMNPHNAEEVFETANTRCLFTLKHLNDQEKILEAKLAAEGKHILKDELGRRGTFVKLPNKRVIFVDDPKGICYVDQFLSEEESNKFIKKGKNQIPTNEEYGAAGLDPIASGDAPVDAGSDACLMIRNRYSSMNPDKTGVPVCMILGRMQDVTKFYEIVFNALQYYGVKVLAERAPISWQTYAIDNHLTGYLYGTTMSDGSEKYGVAAQNASTRDEHAEAQVLSSIHDHDKIPFIRLVRDRKGFSILKRTEWDAGMADGYALIAMKIPFKKAKVIPPERRVIKMGRVLT